MTPGRRGGGLAPALRHGASARPRGGIDERRRVVLVRDLDRNVDRDRPRLRLEQQREADDADADQHHGADQPLARARARTLHLVAGLRVRRAGARGVLALEQGQQTHAMPCQWARGAKRGGSSGSPARRPRISRDACGGDPRQPVLQYAAHGVERAEDDDSISGVRTLDGRAQCRHRVGMTGRPAAAALANRAPRAAPPVRPRLPRAASADRRNATRRPAARAARACRRCPCRASRRTPPGCAG